MRSAGWQKGLPCFFMPPHGSAILRAVFRHIRHPVCTILVACQTKGGAACGARGGLFFVECGHVSVRAAAGRQAGGPARAGQGRAGGLRRAGRGAGAVRPGAAAPANPGAGRPALCGGAVLSHARAGSLPARLCIHAGRVADAGRRSAGAHFPWRARAARADGRRRRGAAGLPAGHPSAQCPVRCAAGGAQGGRKRRDSSRHAGQRQPSARSL